jgi:transcription termination/antitermination protein NusA
MLPFLIYNNIIYKYMASEIKKAIEAICHEKGLEYDEVLESLHIALGAAYRKDFGNKQQNLKVEYDVETGDMKVWDIKEVVEDIDEEKLEADNEEITKRREKAIEEGRELTDEEIEDLSRFNPKMELMLAEAKEYKKTAKIGDILEMEQELPGEFGRMAAQTAKQVIIQKLREAERNVVFDDFKEQEKSIVQGIVQKRDRSGTVIVDLGKINGIVPPDEQIRGEFYKPGVRMKFFIMRVEDGVRGPQIILSRASKDIVSAVLEQEIPEIESGEVIVKGIAREAGARSKVSVHTDDESIDPIGACIGQRGSRITTIIDELGGEKIDVIQYKEDPKEYIKEALSPAKIDSVELNEEAKEAIVRVDSEHFSLAIGRNGQNVRLAAELTGWKIDVIESGKSDENTEDGEVKEESKEENNVEEKAEEDTSVTIEVEEVKGKSKKEDKELSDKDGAVVVEKKVKKIQKAKKKSKKDEKVKKTVVVEEEKKETEEIKETK